MSQSSVFFFSSRRRHTRSVSAFLLNRSSDLSLVAVGGKRTSARVNIVPCSGTKKRGTECRSEERFSRNAETDLVCRLLLEKKKKKYKEIKQQEIKTASYTPETRTIVIYICAN